MVHVNRNNSPFGAGWSLSAWEELHMTDDGSVIRFDGRGSQLLYELIDDGSGQYQSPPADPIEQTSISITGGSDRIPRQRFESRAVSAFK